MIHLIVDFVIFVVGIALGFVGAFVVNKYENKTASQIQKSVDDLTANVQNQVEDVKAQINQKK